MNRWNVRKPKLWNCKGLASMHSKKKMKFDIFVTVRHNSRRATSSTLLHRSSPTQTRRIDSSAPSPGRFLRRLGTFFGIISLSRLPFEHLCSPICIFLIHSPVPELPSRSITTAFQIFPSWDRSVKEFGHTCKWKCRTVHFCYWSVFSCSDMIELRSKNDDDAPIWFVYNHFGLDGCKGP